MLSDLNHIDNLIHGDSGLTLLTKRNASFILSFLYKTFKTDQIADSRAIEQNFLVQVLSNYINSFENVNSIIDDDYLSETSTVELDNEDKALNLIKSWSDPKNGFIFRYYDSDGTEMVELSAGLERLFRYLNEVEDSKKLFIGTESRFAEILDRIKELDVNTIDNPLAKIKELEKAKAEIEAQIAEIQETGHAPTLTPLQVSERITGLEKTAQALISDFRQLKDNNHKIFSELCHRQLEATENRGEILGYILNQSDELENSPQGQSFNGFWKYLSEIEPENSIASKAESIHNRLPNQRIDIDFFRRIEDSLYMSGKNILDENHLLSERLKKAIIRKTSAEYQFIAKTLKDIKTLAIKNKNDISYKQTLFTMDGNANISNNMIRPLVLPETPVDSTLTSISNVEPPKFDISQLFADIYINEEAIGKIIKEEVAKAKIEKRDLSVQYLFNIHQIKYGLAEILTYLSILFKTKNCVINDDETELIYYTSYETKEKTSLSIPKVVIKYENK